LAEFFEVGHVEVGHSPSPNLACLPQAFRSFDGFRQGNAASPMQQVEIDYVSVMLRLELEERA
jgi:hypothetical protein